jgi:DNA/RNA non-specific endonuclease
MKSSQSFLATAAIVLMTACNNQPSLSDIGLTNEAVGTSSDSKIPDGVLSATEPAAVQRGVSAGKELTIKGTLALEVNASGYAARELEIKTNNLTTNGNRIQTALNAKCLDQSSLNICLAGKAVEQIKALKTVLAPDINALTTANTPTNLVTINGSVKIKTAAQWTNFLALIGTGARLNGNLNVEVNAALNNTTLLVEGKSEFEGGLTLENSKLIAKSIETRGLSLQGKNLVLARQNIELKKQSSSGDEISQLIAGQDIEVSSGHVGKLAAALWAGKDIKIEGSLDIFGGVLAAQDVEVKGSLSVAIQAPSSRLAQNLGGAAELATFLEGDKTLVADLLAEYGLKFVDGTSAARAIQTRTASDCAESTFANPRITSAAGSVVNQGANGSYSVDSLGRPYQGLKTVAKPAVATVRSSAVSACSAAVGKIESPTATAGTDQGGHLIGLQYGGWGLRLNLAPQFASFNTGNWLQLENAVTKCGNLAGTKTATVTVTVTFPSTTTNRPSTFAMSIAVTGAAIINGSFPNTDLGGVNGTSTRTTMTTALTAAGCI